MNRDGFARAGRADSENIQKNAGFQRELDGGVAAFAEAGARQGSDLNLPGVLFNRLVSENASVRAAWPMGICRGRNSTSTGRRPRWTARRSSFSIMAAAGGAESGACIASSARRWRPQGFTAGHPRLPPLPQGRLPHFHRRLGARLCLGAEKSQRRRAEPAFCGDGSFRRRTYRRASGGRSALSGRRAASRRRGRPGRPLCLRSDHLAAHQRHFPRGGGKSG